MLPCQIKPTLIRAPSVINGFNSQSSDGKNVAQYEAVFLQLADEHRTVNAFELHELLEACLPNGKPKTDNFYITSPGNNRLIISVDRLHQKLRQSRCVSTTGLGF